MITWLCVGALIFWLDFLIKNLAEKKLKGKGKLKSTKTGFSLQLVHNKGFALNKWESHPDWVKTLQSLMMILVGVYAGIRMCFSKTGKIALTGWSFLLGGGASNLFDRLYRGYVVDYLGLPKIKDLYFNLSDLCIFLGSVLVVLGECKKK